MFSPPQLTVVRCKPECKKALTDEINAKLVNEYQNRFLDVPEILSIGSIWWGTDFLEIHSRFTKLLS